MEHPELAKNIDKDKLCEAHEYQGRSATFVRRLLLTNPNLLRFFVEHHEAFRGELTLSYMQLDKSPQSPHGFYDLALRSVGGQKLLCSLALRQLEFAIDMLVTYYDNKLSEGPLFSMTCRFAPIVAISAMKSVRKHAPSIDLVKVLFGPDLTNFSLLLSLTGYSDAHGFLVGMAAKNCTNCRKMPPVLFGVSIPISFDGKDKLIPWVMLCQTNEGRDILLSYLDDNDKNAKLLAANIDLFTKKKFFCDGSEFDKMNSLEILSKSEQGLKLIAKLVSLNKSLSDHLPPAARSSTPVMAGSSLLFSQQSTDTSSKRDTPRPSS